MIFDRCLCDLRMNKPCPIERERFDLERKKEPRIAIVPVDSSGSIGRRWRVLLFSSLMSSMSLKWCNCYYFGASLNKCKQDRSSRNE